MKGIWSREKVFSVYPFLWPTLHMPVINCETEPCIFLQAYGLKNTSGKINFLVLYRSAGKAMVWQSRRTWLKTEIKFWCIMTIGKWSILGMDSWWSWVQCHRKFSWGEMWERIGSHYHQIPRPVVQKLLNTCDTWRKSEFSSSFQ